MTWVQINERLLELEKRELNEEEIKEWNRLLDKKVAGTLKRNKKNEKSIRQAEVKERGKEEDASTDAVSLHGRVAEEKALL